MSETEYINATNLGKIRAVRAAADQLLGGGIASEDAIAELVRTAWRLEELLARHVKVKP